MARKITFDIAGDPDTINFGIGQPSEDLLPVGIMRAAAEGFRDHHKCRVDGAPPRCPLLRADWRLISTKGSATATGLRNASQKTSAITKRASGIRPPIVVLTGLDDPKTAIEAVDRLAATREKQDHGNDDQ